MPEIHDKAFAAVFAQHFKDVYKYVAFRLSPKIDDAADITQEVFLSAFKGWSRFRGEASPRTWLRTIARRKLADHFSKARPGLQVDFDTLPGTAGIDTSVGRAVTLAATLRVLPSEQADLLEDKYMEGLSVRQIAEKLHKSEKAIESGLVRARQLLRETYLKLQTKQETYNESQ